MKILVLNPNTSQAVTDRIAGVVQRIARPDTEAVVAQIPHGPEVLESYYDESLATPYVLQAVKEAAGQGFDAVIIAAFCDPGLEAVKEISTIPVYALEETAFSVALLLGNKFGILTEKKHKVAVKQQHVRKHGLESRFASVRPLNMGVAEIACDAGARQAGRHRGGAPHGGGGWRRGDHHGLRVDGRLLRRPGTRAGRPGAGSRCGYPQGGGRTHRDRRAPLQDRIVRDA